MKKTETRGVVYDMIARHNHAKTVCIEDKVTPVDGIVSEDPIYRFASAHNNWTALPCNDQQKFVLF